MLGRKQFRKVHFARLNCLLIFLPHKRPFDYTPYVVFGQACVLNRFSSTERRESVQQ